MRKGASSDMFPLSRDLNNPFISNSEKVINDSYTKCLQGLELSIPVNLSAILKFVKDLGKKVREQIKENNNQIQEFYVLYILSAGLIDDLDDIFRLLEDEWSTLPIQVHLINLQTKNMSQNELDSLKF